MNNAIVQFNINPDLYARTNFETAIRKTNPTTFEYSKKSLRLYSDKYSIDHIIITEPKINYEHPTWERLDFWFDKTWFEKYDNICYVDTDVFALPEADNIFQEVLDIDHFYRIPYHKNVYKLKNDLLFGSLEYDRIEKCRFQAGVILLNKNVINATLPIVSRYKESIFVDDSCLLNYAIMDSNIKIKNISTNFNVKFQHHFNAGMESLRGINFLHAFGRYKHKHGDKFTTSFLPRIFGPINQ